MTDVLAELARGEGVVNPLRWGVRLPEGRGILGMMPAALSNPPLVGLKLVTIFPGNHGTELDAHQGYVMLFDPDRGFPVALVDGSEITSIRTAAVSALATRHLANPDAGDLALIGAGIQARSHLRAIQEVRQLRRVRVFSRQKPHRETFAREMSVLAAVDIEVVDNAQDALIDADIVCTTTSSKEPVLSRDWLSAGVHVNAVGACVPTARELDSATVAAARVVVDSRESALAEAGDLLLAQQDGSFEVSLDNLPELGEVILGTANGRRSTEEITVFESLGLGVEDLVAADWVVRRAREEGLGQQLDS